ncbi:hypothetical protein CI102_3104 [Trichoderma harzianum]|nr:hypothetical protein CI102_3104 [Trichoderma harzianum]
MYTTIPEELVSLATVKYLGYDDQTATQVWSKWIVKAPGNPVPESVSFDQFDLRFIDHVVAYSYALRGELDTDTDDDTQWIQVMNRCGINEDTQTAIMDPVFRQVRLTETCQFWIRNTVELRYEALQEVQAASREREQLIQRAAVRPGGSGSQGFSQDTAMSAAALRAANAPGSLTIYRGTEKFRLDRLFDSNGNVDNIETLSSRPPTDFCGKASAYYFAVDRDVAIKYACYAKRRSDISSLVIVHATFKNSTIESLSEAEMQRVYWPSEEWKRIIFWSRRGKKLPSDLHKYRQASLIIGTIAGKPNTVYTNLDHHDEIPEEFVLKNSAGRNAVQYVFLNDEGEELLGKAEIKVFPLTSAEFHRYHREAQQNL